MARVFVITGPSGVGKGTLIRTLRERLPNLELSVSATTRAPRPGEEHGTHYHFLDDIEFDRRVLEEVSLDDATIELGVIEEVVVHAVLLPRPRLAGGGGDGELQLGHALEQVANERSLADPGGAGDHEDLPGHPPILRTDDRGGAVGLPRLH